MSVEPVDPAWLSGVLGAPVTHVQVSRRDDDRELACLRLYHRALAEGGVAGYSWDDLITDDRSGLLYWLLVPVQDAADGSPPSYWQPKLRCLESAVRDQDGIALLGESG